MAVIYFNKKDLIKFGNYLLSDKRKESIINHPDFSKESQEMRLKSVSHADVENCFGLNKRVK